ncbi:MAG: AraC family transcriptional regulator [Gemmatimonadota bacterium]
MSDPLTPRRRVGGYAEFAPPGDLREDVSSIWTFEASRHGAPATHRVLPYPGLTVVFHYVRSDGGGVERPRLELFGPVSRVRSFRPEPGLVMQAVELRPESVTRLLGVSPADHLDAIDSWRPSAGPDSVSLFDKLAERALVGDGALGELVRWLRERDADSRLDPAGRISRLALRALRAPRSASLRISDVADRIGVSLRHLRRSVLEVAGASPKRIQRLERLNRVVSVADTRGAPRWSELAVAHGYFDQAHLIRDFRDLTASTPARLHAERRAEPVPG